MQRSKCLPVAQHEGKPSQLLVPQIVIWLDGGSSSWQRAADELNLVPCTYILDVISAAFSEENNISSASALFLSWLRQVRKIHTPPAGTVIAVSKESARLDSAVWATQRLLLLPWQLQSGLKMTLTSHKTATWARPHGCDAYNEKAHRLSFNSFYLFFIKAFFTWQRNSRPGDLVSGESRLLSRLCTSYHPQHEAGGRAKSFVPDIYPPHLKIKRYGSQSSFGN